SSDLERHLTGVDVVEGSVDQRDADIDDRVAGERTGLRGAAHASLDGGDEVLGDHPTGDAALEGDSGAALEGLHFEHDISVLPLAAGLPDELSSGRGGAGSGFPVGDLGLSDVRLDPELVEEAIDDDLEVKFPHSGDERL